jgi:radical SAM-linked protein
VVQRLRIRYAKRGPMRFTSHRDFARALERAILRARVPIAYSQGFTPHPKISYASAAPTGVASEAEYLEIGVRAAVDPAELARALDTALPRGLDILDVVVAGPGALSDRIEASAWRIELPGVSAGQAAAAVAAFLASDEVPVERLTKQGRRTLDARGPVLALAVGVLPLLAEPPIGIVPLLSEREASAEPSGVGGLPCAILDLVVRHVTPTVRPDDVLTGLRAVADLELSAPPRATRLVQGGLTAEGEIVDPLSADREMAGTRASSG